MTATFIWPKKVPLRHVSFLLLFHHKKNRAEPAPAICSELFKTEGYRRRTTPAREGESSTSSTMTAPGPLLLLLCLGLSDVAPAWTMCGPLSIHNLRCTYNYNKRISCEWTSDTTDMCTIEAQKLNVHKLKNFYSYSSQCTLTPSDQSGLRRCSLLFTSKMKIFDILSLNLSCAQLSQSLVTNIKVDCHVKLDAPYKLVINGSSLSWADPKIDPLSTLEYELQWKPQQLSWRNWPKPIRCEKSCRAELDTESLVLGGKYSARARVRVKESEWSNWGPTLSWESTVGEEQQHEFVHAGSEETPAFSWIFASVMAVILVLILITFRTSRTHWDYVMKLVKGDHLSRSAPSSLKGWKSSPFSSESFLTFLRPVDIIASVEVLHATPRPPLSPFLADKLLAPPCSSRTSFFNPMYPHLCPTIPLLPCSADSPYGPHPEPNPDSNPEPESNPDLQSHMGELPCPELDLLQLLMSQQFQGVPVSEYERVEAVGTSEDRVRLFSVDSGVGSGEEVSHDSLHLLEDQAIGSSLILEDQTGPHPPGSLTPMIETS